MIQTIAAWIVLPTVAVTDLEADREEFLEGIRRGCLSGEVTEESDRLALKRQCRCLVEGVRETLTDEDLRFLMEVTDQQAFLDSPPFKKMQEVGERCSEEG